MATNKQFLAELREIVESVQAQVTTARDEAIAREVRVATEARCIADAEREMAIRRNEWQLVCEEMRLKGLLSINCAEMTAEQAQGVAMALNQIAERFKRYI